MKCLFSVVKKVLVALVVLGAGLSAERQARAKPIYWDWSKINTEDISFPKEFLWGTSDSAFQTEGVVTTGGREIENSWTDYEKMLKQKGELVAPVGRGCDRWNLYKEDIARMKSLGMNLYRFSVEWAKIEPEEGIFDHEAMEHYVDMIDEMLAAGITPMLTLFHHTYPLWFAANGGFEKMENYAAFADFALYVFERLHTKVPFWMIFNEPVAYAIEGYWRGMYPPGKKSFTLAGQVALNQLNIHVMLYHKFKEIDATVQIGMAQIFNPLEAYHWWNPMERLAVFMMNYLVNQLTIDFFKNGKFSWVKLVRGKNKRARGAIDFFGINYYTHTVVKQAGLVKMVPTMREGEIIVGGLSEGRGAKVMYAEGLLSVIEATSKLRVPLFITENGASTEDAAIRQEYIKRHLYVVSRALQQGYPLAGYCFWTLTDCFCWRKGYGNKHGIYAVDLETQERTLRSSCQYLVDVIARFSGSEALLSG